MNSETNSEDTCSICEESIFQNYYGKWNMRIVNGNWDEFHDDFDYDDYEINYCFKCGKKFE